MEDSYIMWKGTEGKFPFSYFVEFYADYFASGAPLYWAYHNDSE